MNQVFVIQNQAGLFLSRQGEWVGPDELNRLFKTPHYDLAINELFEATAKHSDLRALVVEVAASNRGMPLVADLPPPAIPGMPTPAPEPTLTVAGPQTPATHENGMVTLKDDDGA